MGKHWTEHKFGCVNNVHLDTPRRVENDFAKLSIPHFKFGSLVSPGFGAASARSPQFLHFLRSSLSLNSFTASLICVPKSMQWKEASSTISWQFVQYQRKRSRESLGRACSSTIPTVLAKRTGLWGVLGGRRNISPSPIMMSLKLPSSTTFSIMAPLYW